MRKTYFNIFGFVRIAVIIIALCVACACSGNDDTTDVGKGDPVNLRVSAAATSNPGDIDNYVSSLRILAVERSGGRVIANVFYNADKVADGNFTLSVKQTALRLYFIANERMSMTAGLNGVVSESELFSQSFAEEAYAPGFVPSEMMPFIMSASKDVDIPASWDSGSTFVIHEPVSLVRVTSKITLSLKKDFVYTTEDNNKTYKSVVKMLSADVIRVPAKHKVISSGKAYEGEFYTPNVSLTRKTGGEYDTNDNWTDVFSPVYVPEHIVADNNPNFATVIAVKLEHSLVNIKEPAEILGSKSEKIFYIPIQTKAGGNSILRNNHYIVNCLLKAWSDDIYAKTEIMPWDKEYIDVEFDKPEYDFITYTEQKDPQNGNPIITAASPKVSYGFCLKGPKSARWKASLTNGRHFMFKSNEFGFADPDNYITITVDAVFPWEDGLPFVRNTDLVITVNEKETIRIKNITQAG